LIVQGFAVHFGVAQGVQLIAGFTVDGGVVDRRDQRLVQHAVFERVAHVEVVGATADAFKADQARGHARVRTPAVEAGAPGARSSDAGQHVSADRVDRHAVRAGRGQRVALRLAGERVDVVVVETEAVRLATGELTIAQGQFVALIAFDRTGGAPAVATG